MSLAANQLNKSIFLLPAPVQWALRYRDRPQVDCPLFVKFTGKSATRKAVLLDIHGQADQELAFHTAENGLDSGPANALQNDALSIPAEIVQALSEHRVVTPQHAPALVLAIVNSMAQFNEDWQELKDLIDSGRYQASAWFERDRKNLCLTDLFTNREVVELWDHDVDGAIEDGFLRPPRCPRPNDHDWLNPLMDYARCQGTLVVPTPMAQAAGVNQLHEHHAVPRRGFSS